MKPGETFPDLDLPDHPGRPRLLSELAGGDPLALFTSRGWWCPKGAAPPARAVPPPGRVRGGLREDGRGERRPEVQAAFRAGLGARFTFLSDSERRWLPRLGLLESTDTLHHPYRPAAFTLFPALTVHRDYNGYWYTGRPTLEELRRDMREITRSIRPDWEVPQA